VTVRVHHAIRPRDGFFFKDGRGWHTSASGRGRGLDWPFPTTVRGAMRTAYGRGREAILGRAFDRRAWDEETRAVRLGAVLGLRRPYASATWTAEHRMWPVPLDASFVGGTGLVRPLEPFDPRRLVGCGPGVTTLGRDDDPIRERLWWPVPRDGEEHDAGKPVEPPEWWTDDEFASWLGGALVAALSPGHAGRARIPRRVDVRLAIDPATITAQDGALFAHDVCETLQRCEDALHEWALGCAADLPAAAELVTRPWTLGSDRRLARAEIIDAAVFDDRPDAVAVAAPRIRLIVVTPAHFARGWIPDGFEASAEHGEYRGALPGIDGEVVLRAAFVGRPAHVSGWDMTGGQPKPTRRLVPPGSVYFFEKVGGGAFTPAELGSLWLAPLGHDVRDIHDGLNRVVAGPWPTEWRDVDSPESRDPA
jgi:CRISPR-associated protein Cmr3